MRRTDTPSGSLRGLLWTAAALLSVFILYQVTVTLRGPFSYDFGVYVITPLIAALMAGVAGALAYAQRTNRRLSSLVDEIRKVASGDYAAQADNSEIEALGEIGRAFNVMVGSLSSARDLLIERANTDALTGLSNHRCFQERLASEFTRATRYNSRLSLMMIDIDHFKLFNDLNGHPIGDSALQDIAKVISEQVRDVDLAARYGGEEFAVILPETSVVQAAILAERTREAVEQQVFKQANEKSCKLTLSIGVAEFPTHCSDKASLLRAADAALYHAKMQGRNMVVAFEGERGEDPKPDPHKLYVLLHATDITTVEALAAAIDTKHGYPSGHTLAIAQMACRIGRNLCLSEEEISSLYVASLLRDIGQIAIPDSVLEKADGLSEQEKQMVERHPVLGHAIVQKSPYMSAMLPAVLHHHERFDGTGYPEGLAGVQIPLSARIISAVDAYLSMMTDRPYRDRLTVQKAQSELARLAGTQFDPIVVAALLEAARDEMDKAA